MSEQSVEHSNANANFHSKMDIKENPILHYANIAGVLPNNYNINEDLVIKVPFGFDLREYVYNPRSDIILCKSSSGTKQFFKDEKSEQKRFLIHELKKLWLENKYRDNIQKLYQGEFSDEQLVVGQDDSKIKTLEEKLRKVDELVSTLSETGHNYGHTFFEQFDSFESTLKSLLSLSNGYDGNALHKLADKFKSVAQNFNRLKSSGTRNSANLDGNPNVRKFLVLCVNIILSADFSVESVTKLKDRKEFHQLKDTGPSELFGDLIRELKQMILLIRKDEIGGELNTTKIIEEQIRAKRQEIFKIKSDFSEEYQISESDEKRYKRLLKTQRLESNRKYKDGFGKTKESVNEQKLESQVTNFKYDLVDEAKAIKDIRHTIQKENGRIKSKTENIAKKRQELMDAQEDKIPTLEEERDLMLVMTGKLKNMLSEAEEKQKSLLQSQNKSEREINELQKDIDKNKAEINAKYDKLRDLLDDIENYKSDIKRLQTAKVAVEGEEINSFKDSIFEKAGGQKKGTSPTGYVNHEDCKPDITFDSSANHCRYRNATDETVDFALDQIMYKKIFHLNKTDLWHWLRNYHHSADGGNGKHASSLIEAGERVFREYRDVQSRIQKRQDEYQNQINDAEKKQKTKETERDSVRKIIVDKENTLNKLNINLKEGERKFKVNAALIGHREDLIGRLEKYKETADGHKESLNDEIKKLEEEIETIVKDDIPDLKRDIQDVEKEINMEGSHNKELTLLEARWRVSQYEKIITNIGDLEKQKVERTRLENESNEVENKLQENQKEKERHRNELEDHRSAINNSVDIIRQLIEQKNKFIERRSFLERNSATGLVNAIHSCRQRIKEIEKRHSNELKEKDKGKTEVIKRKVYDQINISHKGTTKTGDGMGDRDDTGAPNQLYKKRRHKDCQDNFQDRYPQNCKYFDAVLEIITKLLSETESMTDGISTYKGDGAISVESKNSGGISIESKDDGRISLQPNSSGGTSTDSKIIGEIITESKSDGGGGISSEPISDDVIFTELQNKNDENYNHVLAKHKDDIKEGINVIRKSIIKFKKDRENIKTEHAKELEPVNFLLTKCIKDLAEQKTLAGYIRVKSEIEYDSEKINDHLGSDFDIVFVDDQHIYTRKHSNLATDDFIRHILEFRAECKVSSTLSTEDVKEELHKILESRKAVPLEAVLLQKKNTNQKELYKLLVHYFNKKYMKTKLEMYEQINIKMGLEEKVREVNAKIQAIDKEEIHLKSVQLNHRHFLALNSTEIERLEQILTAVHLINGSGTKKFQSMRELCVELQKKAKNDNLEDTNAISNRKLKLQSLKDSLKKLDKSLDSISFENVQEKVLKNRLKVGIQMQSDQHRICSDSCDFLDKAKLLIKETRKDIQEGKIRLTSPEYKVLRKDQNNLIERLNLNQGHSKIHDTALRRIIVTVGEECGKEIENIRTIRGDEINNLGWEIEKRKLSIECRNEEILPQLEQRIQEIDNLLNFKKDVTFRERDPKEETSSEKELREYKEERFKNVFQEQIKILISCLYGVRSQINVLYRPFTESEIKAIQKSFYDKFKEYFKGLELNNSLIDQLILNLEKEAKDNSPSKLKTLVRKKSGKLGAVNYLINRISWSFKKYNETYNESMSLDPEIIYHKIQIQNSEEQQKIEEATLKELQQELLLLEEKRKELSMQSNVFLNEELQNIETCKNVLKHKKEVVDLERRAEELDESRRNKDDYYAFDINGRKMGIRLLSLDPIEKSAEIKNIDKIRSHIEEINDILLEKKVLSESLQNDLKEERKRQLDMSFLEIQRKLFVSGISLCGYDSFKNSEPLDQINGFISVVAAFLIGQNNLYQKDSVNETSEVVEKFTRKIRQKFNDSSANKSTSEKIQFEFIMKLINEEFQTDESISPISQINVLGNSSGVIIYEGDKSDPSINNILTLLIHESKYFSLLSRDRITLHGDQQLDLEMKITHMQGFLQTEEDLFKYLCEKRLRDFLGIQLEVYKKLGEIYKQEQSILAKIKTLKEFNANFCHILDVSENVDNQSISLFAYLSYLEKLENGISDNDQQNKLSRLKSIKNLYGRSLYALIKAEQARRQRKNENQLKESREELYLAEMIENKKQDLTLLLQDIQKKEETIEKDQTLISSLLLEKEGAIDKFREKIEELSNISRELKEILKLAQERMRELNARQNKNENQINEAKAEVNRLEKELEKVEQEIQSKENDKKALEIEIDNLKTRSRELEEERKRVSSDKERKEKEEAEKKGELEISESIKQFIKNLKFILGNGSLQSKIGEIKTCLYESTVLSKLLGNLKMVTEKFFGEEGKNVWQLLVSDINYEKFNEYVKTGKPIAGESHHDIIQRLRSIFSSAVNMECEIVHELVKDKVIRKFKISAVNVSYANMHKKLKEKVENEMQKNESCKGLSFVGNLLKSTDYGVTGIQDLPLELKNLIERRIELYFKSEDVGAKKNSKFSDASKVINELKIDYKDVVRCFVDEIEIIACGTFVLDSSLSYPGIDLTINAVDMECVGKVILDTSGNSFPKFIHKASDGFLKRSNAGQPRGDKGYDGFDGEHGGHGGNIIIKIENTIKNLAGLIAIKSNGGNGGEGQLGGNGDEGKKGENGEDGVAPDTSGLGNGQTTIGFGKPGKPGGIGGDPGDTGRPGMGGRPGVIDIEHKGGKIDGGEMRAGKEGENILEKQKPTGGEGGEPGLYGIDQVQDKVNFFHKTKTYYTIVDRAALIKQHPTWEKEILDGKNVDSSNNIALIGILWFNPITFLATTLSSTRLTIEEKDSNSEYRNRDKTIGSRWGKRNERGATLRSDHRVEPENKREAANVEALHGKLKEKKADEKEISGESQHGEHISDLVVELEELVGEIENSNQELADINSDIESTTLATEAKYLELDKINEDIKSLKNKELSLNSDRMDKFNQIMREISESRNLRDKKKGLNLQMTQELAALEKYNALRQDYAGNKEQFLNIIDEYLQAVRQRQKRSRYDLKLLKRDYGNKEAEIRNLSRKLESLHRDRISEMISEVQNEAEVEEEIETQHAEEFTNVIDSDMRNQSKMNTKQESKISFKHQSNENSYISTENVVDLENIPTDIREIERYLNASVRHYRSGVDNDERVRLINEALSRTTNYNKHLKFLLGKSLRPGLANDERKRLTNENTAAIMTRIKTPKYAEDLQIILEKYNKEINDIKLANNLESLSAIQRNLLQNYLTKFRNDPMHLFYNDKNSGTFVYKMISQIRGNVQENDEINVKLKNASQGNILADTSSIKSDFDNLSNLIEDQITFHLEKCAIDFTKIGKSPTKCEKAMLDYNRKPTLGNLAVLVTEFKIFTDKDKLDQKYFSQSAKAFLKTLLENVKHHTLLVLDDILVHKNDSQNNHEELKIKKSVEHLKVIVEDMETVRKVVGSERFLSYAFIWKFSSFPPIALRILNMVTFFQHAVSTVVMSAASKKNINRTIASLNILAKKLLKYVDENENDIKIVKIIHRFLGLVISENGARAQDSHLQTFKESIEELTGEIESIEDAVIGLYSDNKEVKEGNSNEIDMGDKIETLVEFLTGKIQKRYESLGEVDEVVRSLVLKVISTDEVKNQSDINKARKKLTNIVETLNRNENRKNFLLEALEKNKFDIALVDGVQKAKTIEEFISKMIISDESKAKLLSEYKTAEFSKLQSSIYGHEWVEVPTTTPKTIEEISGELIEGKNENRVELVKKYSQLCAEMADLIRTQLSVGINQSGDDALINMVMPLIEGLENFSSHDYRRHVVLDKVLMLLRTKNNPEQNMYQNNEEIASVIKHIKTNAVSSQWNAFLESHKGLLGTNKDKIRNSERKLQFSRIFDAFCKNDVTNDNIEELKYHTGNLIENQELNSQVIYSMVNKVKNAGLSNTTKKLVSYVQARADYMELEKLRLLFNVRLSHQEEQSKLVVDTKKRIAKEFWKFCGMSVLDKRQQVNRNDLFELHLEKLDRLVANQNGEDISYSERIKILGDLEKSVNIVIGDAAVSEMEKADAIENEVSNTVSRLIFNQSPVLPVGIFQHLDKLLNSTLISTLTEYKTYSPGKHHVKLEDLFDDFGRVKEDEGESVFRKNRIVIVDFGEYYRLAKNIEALMRSPTTYKNSREEFGKGLLAAFKLYKLNQFKKAIVAFNSDKSLKNLLNINSGLVFYLSLLEDHLDSEQSSENSFHSFLNDYHKIVKHLMITQKADQELICELRKASDSYVENVLGVKGVEGGDTERQKLLLEMTSNLKSLRNTLLYKSYKVQGFKLFQEEKEMFTQEMERNNFLNQHLTEIILRDIPELIWLRSLVMPDGSEIFFQLLNDKINTTLANDLKNTNSVSVKEIRAFTAQAKNNILLAGLVDDHSKIDVHSFVQRIGKNELAWKWVLTGRRIDDSSKFKKLKIVIEKHEPEFSKEILEDLILALSQIDQRDDSIRFSKDILTMYTKKVIENQKNIFQTMNSKHDDIHDEILGKLELAITNASNVLKIDQEKVTHVGFVNHLKKLQSKIKIVLENNSNNVEILFDEIEIEFVANILGLSNTQNGQVFSKFKTLKNFNDRIQYIKYLLRFPDSFFKNKKSDYQEFINFVLKYPTRFNTEPEQTQKLYYYAREMICTYYDVFLDEIIDTRLEDAPSLKADILEALQRLYDLISAEDFVKLFPGWLSAENENNKPKLNFVLDGFYQMKREGKSILQTIKESLDIFALNIDLIIRGHNFTNKLPSAYNPILYEEEKAHLRAIIANFEMRLTEKWALISELQELFVSKDSSIKTWREDLIYLRIKLVKDFILTKFPAAEQGTTKLSDVLNAYRYFQEQQDNLTNALNTLDLLCKSIDKFSSIDEVQDCILSFSSEKDLSIVSGFLTSANKQNLPVELLFLQINAGNNIKVENALTKLKLVLSSRSYEEIRDFCKLFILQLSEKTVSDNLHITMDLIVKTKFYLKGDALKDLEDKDISLWDSYLERVTTETSLTSKSFHQCGHKTRNQTVQLLCQIKEERGEQIQKLLIGKINDLTHNDRDPFPIKKLNVLLSKMIHKPCNWLALENLSKNLSDWEGILFSENEAKSGELLSIKKILELMREGNKVGPGGINASIAPILQVANEEKQTPLIELIVKQAKNLNKLSKIYKSSKHISEWEEKEVRGWSKAFKSSRQNDSLSWDDGKGFMDVAELVSVIIRAVIIYDRYPQGPRDTQLLALLLFLKGKLKGRMGNVYTGEGKTLITVMLATCLALLGKKVDVVSSSKVLAIRDSQKREPGMKEGYRGFFELFELKANNNCDELCEHPDTGEIERKRRYSTCEIIYGETGYFQRDLLLSKYFNREIREGEGIGDVLILDEVDSMMIDNAAKTLYISHSITDMRHLRDVFIHIWAAVNSREERNYSEENVQKIAEYINKIIGHNPNSPEEIREFKVDIPKTLNDFVQLNLRTWIESAYDAKYIAEDNSYIIGDADSQNINEVIIMDKDTGVEQTSTKWSNGLHQFLQLKHSGKLSDVSLKVVYISNASYFKSYNNLYGMTGTVGGVEERKLLTDVYGVDFFEMPRFKEYRFEYDFESEFVAENTEEWLQNITENIHENMEQQLVITQMHLDSIRDKCRKEKEALQKLEIELKSRGRIQTDLESKHADCKNKIFLVESVDVISKEVIEICQNPVLDQFKSKLIQIQEKTEKIKETMNNLDLDELGDKIQVIFAIIEAIIKSKSELDIESLGSDFSFGYKNTSLVDIGNKEKENLENLLLSISKTEERINYLNTAILDSKEAIAFYENLLMGNAGSQIEDSRRAVLIICDSINDLKFVEKSVRQKFIDNSKYKIYTYDRAYKKFDVSRLEAGDIVIATNIAGRGTDLQVSKKVEENGGLHVILSYMPKNFRIEKQAFGRTARAGNRGTATYIVLDSRKYYEDIDILQLKNERNEAEASRLKTVQNEQLPKIKLEDELFVKFNKLLQSLQSELKSSEYDSNKDKKSENPLMLQIESLKNHWAVWLNKMSDKFNKIHEDGTSEIFREFQNFEIEMRGKLNNTYGLVEEPGELNKLGRIYLDSALYSKALDCFNHVIDNHPAFASIAFYYKAFCIINKDGGGFDSKIKSKAVLKRSLKSLEDERSRILSRNQILKSINEVARARGQGLRSNYFAKQNEGEAQVLSVHINAINSAIGSEISPECFNAAGIVGDLPQKVFDELSKSEYDVIKDFRICKKIIIASKILIQGREQQKQALALNTIPSEDFGTILDFVGTHNKDYVKYNKSDAMKGYESYKKSLKTLQDAKIVSERKIFKNSDLNGDLNTESHLIHFPDVFEYCKEDILDFFELKLFNSQINSWGYKERIIKSNNFDGLIYTKDTFLKDSADIISVEEMVVKSNEINQKLLGRLDDQVFRGKGNEIKHILISDLLRVDHTYLKKKITRAKNDEIFLGKKSELQEFCSGQRVITNAGKIIQLLDNQLTFQDDVKFGLKTIVDLSDSSSAEDKAKFKSLLSYLGFDKPAGKKLVKNQLVRLIKDTTMLQEKQILAILEHLESYVELNIDHKYLKQKFQKVSNEAIFFGKRSEIMEFCSGSRKVTIGNSKKFVLLDNQSYDINEVQSALKLLVKLPENPSSEDKINFDALLIQLGFDTGLKFEAIRSHNQYSFKDNSKINEIKEYLEVINLKDASKNEGNANKIDLLDFSVDSRLAKVSGKISEILKSNLYVDRPLTKKDFPLRDDEFAILRALLTDANIISTSIFHLFSDSINKNLKTNSELEKILLSIYQSDDGIISDGDILLKDAKSGSQEIFARMLDLKVIKPPRVNFKDNWDAVKRMEYISNKIESVVKKVFKLERRDDFGHQANEYVTGGIGTESKNKDLDEKIETITNVIKNVAGTIKIFPEIKLDAKDIRTMFSGGKVPPEIMDYIRMSFDAVLEYKEAKGFDWDCFLCAIIGVLQIVAGIAIEVLSGGSLHFIAQTLIAEGIGDIVFAIQSAAEGNFSWKSYGQHKVQSLILSLVTGGVGSFLSKGVQVGKIAVGLATKRAITQTMTKMIIVEACTAVVTAGINIGTEEISKLLIEEIANNHFVQYFEEWTHTQKIRSVETQMNNLYNKFGADIARQNIEACMESTLNQMRSGALGDRIFSQISRLVGSITKSMSMAANRLPKNSSKAKLLGAIASLVEKSVKVSEFSKNFAELCLISNDFYDQLSLELTKTEQNLTEQQKNGTIKMNESQIAEEKVSMSYSEKASDHLKDVQGQMHRAFKEKIKNGFLQPAVGSLLHMAVKPVQKAISAPFVNAMKNLEDHIDSRAEKYQYEIETQSGKVIKLTTKEKRALELREDLIKFENIKNANVLKEELANFEGHTLESLQKMHGPNLSVMVKNGKFYAVLPTFTQFCDDISSGKLKGSGELHIKTAASKEGRAIEIVRGEVDGTNTLIHHEKVPGIVTPIGSSRNQKESFKMSYFEGTGNASGHFAPVIKDENGNWKVIKNIYQTANTKDACFAQAMTFLKAYEELGDLTMAKVKALEAETVSKYQNSLGKFSKGNKYIKDFYFEGTTAKSGAIFGGVQDRLRQRLENNYYPSHENRIVADQALKAPLAALHNELIEKHKVAEEFQESRTLSQKYKWIKQRKYIPSFGDTDLELKSKKFEVYKTEMMMGTLEVEFTDGTKFQKFAVSGDTPFSTTVLFPKEPTVTYTHQLKPFTFHYKGFDFFDPGKPTGKIYDVYNKRKTNKEYDKSCAAQKLFYGLQQHMIANPDLEIKGRIKMAESWYKKIIKTNKDNIIVEKSCAHCEAVLPFATGSFVPPPSNKNRQPAAGNKTN